MPLVSLRSEYSWTKLAARIDCSQLRSICVLCRSKIRVACRVLAREGHFVSVSFAQPHFRKPFLLAEAYDWSLDVSTIGDTFHYYVYVMQKGHRRDNDTPVAFGWPTRSKAPSGLQDSSMSHDHMDDENYLLVLAPDSMQ